MREGTASIFTYASLFFHHCIKIHYLILVTFKCNINNTNNKRISCTFKFLLILAEEDEPALSPMIGMLIGVASALLILFIVIAIIVRLRTRRRRKGKIDFKIFFKESYCLWLSSFWLCCAIFIGICFYRKGLIMTWYFIWVFFLRRILRIYYEGLQYHKWVSNLLHCVQKLRHHVWKSN